LRDFIKKKIGALSKMINVDIFSWPKNVERSINVSYYADFTFIDVD